VGNNEEENCNGKISIGMPIRNAEDVLENRLKSILAQSFEDFELIISDNCSEDKTSEICEKYSKMDKRIKYFKQSKNIGIHDNFKFVLQKAINEYFVWAAHDDTWHEDYLKRNQNILLTKKDYVCSISKLKWVGPSIEELKISSNDSFFKKIEKRIRAKLGLLYPITTKGGFEERVHECLKKKGSGYIYGVFRTKILKKVLPEDTFLGTETAITLGALKYGNFFVVESELFQKYVGSKGESSGGMIRWIMSINPNKYSILFPLHYLNLWLIKNLGIKLYFKNLDSIISMYFVQYIYLTFNFLQIFKKKIIK